MRSKLEPFKKFAKMLRSHRATRVDTYAREANMPNYIQAKREQTTMANLYGKKGLTRYNFKDDVMMLLSWIEPQARADGRRASDRCRAGRSRTGVRGMSPQKKKKPKRNRPPKAAELATGGREPVPVRDA